MKTILLLTIALIAAGCAQVLPEQTPLGMGLGRGLMSSKLEIKPESGGFTVAMRAGVDKLANDPTWETIRQQDIATAAKSLCPNGIASLTRTATPRQTIEIGTSRDLTYTGRCK